MLSAEIDRPLDSQNRRKSSSHNSKRSSLLDINPEDDTISFQALKDKMILETSS
jgi:hypothetical protein